jgi:hypothetical protein
MEMSGQTGRWWKITRYSLHSMLGGTQNRSGEFLKKEHSFSLTGSEIWTVQPADSPYSDYAISAANGQQIENRL